MVQEPFKECEYYAMDFSSCPENHKDEFLQCAGNLTKETIASCSADEAIFDTSQFTSTVPTEFHLACGSQVIIPQVLGFNFHLAKWTCYFAVFYRSFYWRWNRWIYV